MNKAELIEAMAQETNSSKTDCEKWLNAFTTTIATNVKKDDIRLVGFGTWTTVDRKARMGRNPQTGEEITIAARTVPVFRPGKELKTTVR